MLLSNPEYADIVRPFPTPSLYPLPGQDFATQLVREWLTMYANGKGPLDRYPREQWADAFNIVGFIRARQTLTEKRPGLFTEILRVRTQHDYESLDSAVYRAATVEGKAGWSWTDSLEIAQHIQEERSGTQVWVCEKPLRVFGMIMKTVRAFDEDMHLTKTEWLIEPGDVRPWQDTNQSSNED